MNVSSVVVTIFDAPSDVQVLTMRHMQHLTVHASVLALFVSLGAFATGCGDIIIPASADAATSSEAGNADDTNAQSDGGSDDAPNETASDAAIADGG